VTTNQNGILMSGFMDVRRAISRYLSTHKGTQECKQWFADMRDTLHTTFNLRHLVSFDEVYDKYTEIVAAGGHLVLIDGRWVMRIAWAGDIETSIAASVFGVRILTWQFAEDDLSTGAYTDSKLYMISFPIEYNAAVNPSALRNPNSISGLLTWNIIREGDTGVAASQVAQAQGLVSWGGENAAGFEGGQYGHYLFVDPRPPPSGGGYDPWADAPTNPAPRRKTIKRSAQPHSEPAPEQSLEDLMNAAIKARQQADNAAVLAQQNKTLQTWAAAEERNANELEAKVQTLVEKEANTPTNTPPNPTNPFPTPAASSHLPQADQAAKVDHRPSNWNEMTRKEKLQFARAHQKRLAEERERYAKMSRF
jgi:hypothetical protein